MIDSYEKLPLGKYQAIVKALQTEDELQRQVEVISILKGCTTEEVLDMTIPDYKDAVRKLAFLDSAPADKALKVSSITFNIGGWVLVPLSGVDKMNVAQYVDFQGFIKNGMDNLAEIMSVFLIPEGHRYNDGYDIAKVQDVIREYLVITDVIAIYNFFLGKFTGSINAMLTSLAWTTKNKEIREKIQQMRTLFRQDGDGLRMLMPYLLQSANPGKMSGRWG